MTHTQSYNPRRLTVEDRGRLVIPAELRRALGISPGDELIVYMDDDGRLVLENPREMARRLRGSWRHFAEGRDLVAELLEHREAEAGLEEAEAARDEAAERAARGKLSGRRRGQ